MADKPREIKIVFHEDKSVDKQAIAKILAEHITGGDYEAYLRKVAGNKVDQPNHPT